MEKQRISELSAYSRRWGNISLIENVNNYRRHQKSLKEDMIPKRLGTDFFPTRHVGRKKYKERPFFIISPENHLKVAWDSLKLVLIVIEATIIPYMLSFLPPKIELLQTIVSVMELFFFFDIVIKLNTAVYFNGILFTSRTFIMKKYLKGWFFIDLITVFPYNLIIPEINLEQEYLFIPISSPASFQFLWLLKLIRITSFKPLFYNIEDFFVSSIFLSPIRGLQFLFTVFIWTHWLSCIVYTCFARSLFISSFLWSQYFESVSDRYLRSIYLIIQTMTSVGYGDIPPQTINQRIVAAICMSFACVLFGNIIGNIQGFIDNWDADNKYYEAQARRLKKFLKKINLPDHLRQRIVQYIYYLQTLSKKNDPKELGILDNLSKPLREEIFTQTRGFLLAKSAVFNCYSGSFLKYLGHQMKIEAFAPGDIIFKEGERSTVIYYLCSGKVQIYHEKTKTVFKDVKNSKYFGEIAFFLGRPRTASAQCLEFAEFLTLERSILFNVLSSRPKEQEITNVIIYNTEKYNDLSLLGIRCYLCRKAGHIAATCKAFVFIPNVKEIIKKAEIRKYQNNKSVNIHLIQPSRLRRQTLVTDVFKRHGYVSSKGTPFSANKVFNERNQIVKRIRSFNGKVPHYLDISKVLSLNETEKVDSENSLGSEHSMTFGKGN